MQATLHLPDAAPRPLTAAELATLAPARAGGYLTLDFDAATSTLRDLMGTSIAAEPLASGANYLVVVPANAADYDFGPTPSAESDFTRLTGAELDEPLTGPVLVIED